MKPPSQKKIQAYKFKTPQSKKLYSQKIPIVESHFAHNKHNLKHRQYYIIELENTKTQQTTMATSQNIIKIHNIKLKQQTEGVKTPA